MNTLESLRYANRVRQRYWPGSDKLDELGFRTVEFAGEAGEVADAVKKLMRFDRNAGGNTGQTRGQLLEAIEDEMGDVLISLDLLADKLGISLTQAFVKKFNKTSEKIGNNIFIREETLDTIVGFSA